MIPIFRLQIIGAKKGLKYTKKSILLANEDVVTKLNKMNGHVKSATVVIYVRYEILLLRVLKK